MIYLWTCLTFQNYFTYDYVTTIVLLGHCSAAAHCTWALRTVRRVTTLKVVDFHFVRWTTIEVKDAITLTFPCWGALSEIMLCRVRNYFGGGGTLWLPQTKCVDHDTWGKAGWALDCSLHLTPYRRNLTHAWRFINLSKHLTDTYANKVLLKLYWNSVNIQIHRFWTTPRPPAHNEFQMAQKPWFRWGALPFIQEFPYVWGGVNSLVPYLPFLRSHGQPTLFGGGHSILPTQK